MEATLQDLITRALPVYAAIMTLAMALTLLHLSRRRSGAHIQRASQSARNTHDEHIHIDVKVQHFHDGKRVARGVKIAPE